MSRPPALQPGDRVRIADGKFDPDLIVRVKQVDGDLVEVQLGGGNSASFCRDQISSGRSSGFTSPSTTRRCSNIGGSLLCDPPTLPGLTASPVVPAFTSSGHSAS